MAEIVTHEFVSAKSDSPDTTLVSASEWNDGHVFTGGINGQVLVYDNTQPNNMRWVDGSKVYNDYTAITNPTTSPMVNPVTISFTTTSPVTYVINVYIGLSTVGDVDSVLTLYLDAVLLFTVDPIQSGVPLTTGTVGTTTAGSHIFQGTWTSAGNANFLGTSVEFQLLTIGV